MVQIRSEVPEAIPENVRAAYERYRAMKESVEQGIAELGPDNPVIGEIIAGDEYARALQVYDKLQAIIEAGVMIRPVTAAEREQAQKLDAFITGLLDEVDPLLHLV